MCTSIIYSLNNKDIYLSRTMDFGFELNGHPILIPRNYKKNFLFGTYKGKYGFIGTGEETELLIADGMNEKGLAIAELYFQNEAYYQEEPQEDKINLAPHEFIYWTLMHMENVDELLENIHDICLVNRPIKLLGKTLPLHFIVSDNTGRTIVIEPTINGLLVYENPVNVMTNSPRFDWHLINLNNYVELTPNNRTATKFGTMKVKPFGQGAGTKGLPGGYTSPERFIRAAYLRENVKQLSSDKDDTIITTFRLLDSVTIPLGVNIKENNSSDYTQYRSVYNLNDGEYYFNPYYTNDIYKIKLSEKQLSQKDYIIWEIKKEFSPIELF